MEANGGQELDCELNREQEVESGQAEAGYIAGRSLTMGRMTGKSWITGRSSMAGRRVSMNSATKRGIGIQCRKTLREGTEGPWLPPKDAVILRTFTL